MNRLFFVMLLVVSSIQAQSQKIIFKPGVYLSLEQLRSGVPEYNADLLVQKRTGGDITMYGGNDYKITSVTDSIGKKYIKKDIYAYVKNDSLFLNGFPHSLQLWYALSLTKGNFLLFKGAMSTAEATNVAVMGGAIGGAISASKRYLYVLSLRTGNVRECSPEYLEARLKENNVGLLDEFYAERVTEGNFEWIATKYLQLLNEQLDRLSLID